ncbi:MAG: pyruvate formate lyase family protein [Coriobacteriales bacterium]|jgi:pyruvate-formate lyase
MFEFDPVSPRVQAIIDHRRWVDKGHMRINCERTKLFTDYYKAHENEWPMLKRAGALLYWAQNCSTPVDDGDIIVAALGPETRMINHYVEWSSGWLKPMMNDDDDKWRQAWQSEGSVYMSDEEREWMKEAGEYWPTHDIPGMMAGIVSDDFFEQAANGTNNFPRKDDFVAMCSKPQGHYIAGFRKAVSYGFGAVRQDALDELEKMRGRVFGDNARKQVFYNAVVRTCDAMITLSKRYAEACREKAKSAEDESRRDELNSMADSLDWIMEHPARTYWEGLETIILYQAFLVTDAQQHGQSVGRIDTYLGDLLDADLAAGRITMYEAQEMTDAFILRMGDFLCMDTGVSNDIIIDLQNHGKTLLGFLGQHMTLTSGEHMTVGGVDAYGNDMTNEVTRLVLKAYGHLGVPDPTVAIRIHKNTPDDIWELAIESSKRSGGMPQFQNDDVIIPSLMDRGLSLEEARDYGIVGCVEPSCSAGNEWPACGLTGQESIWCILGCVSFAIHGGVNPISGAKGLPCKTLPEYESFEEFFAEVERQARYSLDWQISLCNMFELMYSHYFPCISASVMMDGCMQSGRDATEGGCIHNRTGLTCVGIGNTADSLESIKKLCFDDKSVSLEEMYEALCDNWVGHEDLKAKIEHEVPHYGNGIEEVDELAARAMRIFSEYLPTLEGPRGRYNGGTFTMLTHLYYGHFVPATPDGRCSGEKLADAISPRQGFDISGPTAYMRSASRLPHRELSNGDQLNIRFNPTSVQGEDGTLKLRQLFETYFGLTGMQVQFNVVSTETLHKAQEDPESYQNLVVRIAGYSAYFVELMKETQDDFITRTEQSM